MPVSKKAAPIINIAIKRRTLLSINPEKVSEGLRTPVSVRPIATNMAVIERGIFSQINIMIAKIKNIKVMTCGSIFLLLSNVIK